MRLLHLSLASLLGSAVGLLLLLAITIQSTSALNGAKTDLDALFELRHRIDNLSVAADNILLFGASPTLWQRLRTDAEDIEQQLQALSNEQPDAAGVAYRIRTLTDALTMLRATSAGTIGHAQTPGATGDSQIEPLQMPERARILLSQIAGHGVMVDEAMGLMLTERREAITREGTRIVVRLALSALVLGLLSIGAFSLIYWRIAAPVRSLAKTVERVSQGDLSARSMVKGRDELAMLASALNRMLDQLSASETRLQQYRQLVEGSDDLMAIADADYRYLLVNQSYARMFGRDPSQIEGAYLWEILGRGYFDAVLRSKLDRCLAGGTEHFETERQDRNGQRRQLLASYFPIQSEKPSERQVVAVITDISELKQVENELREQSHLLDIAGRLARVGGWQVDLETNQARWSRTVAEIHGVPAGYSPSVDDGLSFFDPEDRETIRRALTACAEHGIPYHIEGRIIDAGGSMHWVRTSGEAVRDEQGHITTIQGALQDINTQKVAELKAAALSERLRSTLESITDGFFSLDRDWHFAYLNEEAARLLQQPRDRLIGRNFWSCLPETVGTQIEHAYRQAMLSQETVTFEEYYRPFSTWFEIRAFPSPDGLAVYFQDVSERRRMVRRLQSQKAELSRLVNRDRLTQLLTRDGFTKALADRLAAGDCPPGSVVAMFDIKDLRDVNDSHGFDAGDRLLIEIARWLEQKAGTQGLVGRIAGDEFSVFLPGQPGQEPQELVESLRGIHQHPFLAPELGIEVAIDLGYTLLSDLEHSAEERLQQAELALFQHRQHGTPTPIAYNQDLEAQVHERIALSQDLRAAVANHQLELHFQPKVDLSTGALVACEALLRWNHPTRGLLPPGVFIPVAEQSQQINAIGAWALEEACRYLRDWQEAGLPVVATAVNVSLIQFRSADFVQAVHDTLDAYGIAPGALTLEITETIFEQASQGLLDQLNALRASGVRLSLDDFGTGYSSLAYLQHYPFDEIKVDRSFVARVLDDRYSRTVLSAVKGIAEALGAELIAEGIETEAVRKALLALGYERGQGYLFSVPLETEDFRWLLEQGSRLPLSAERDERVSAHDNPATGGSE